MPAFAALCAFSVRRRRSVALVGLLVLLAGCASGSGGFGGLFGTRLSPALEAQRARLSDALRGTPVLIEASGDRRLHVVVPTRHAFEPGHASVKPALAAVLDQFAIGFKPYAATTELRIGAPAQDHASAGLVRERAGNARTYLISRGVPASRIVAVGPTKASGLELWVSDRPLNNGN